MVKILDFTARELSPSTWKDFEALMAKQGYCWCMYYQRPHSWAKEAAEYSVKKEQIPDHNRRRKKELVEKGEAHGILVNDGSRPVGWCAYGLQGEFPGVDNGRLYRDLKLKNDELRLWRIACFYVDAEYRRRGVAWVALRAALASIRKQGGGTVEAYPRVSKAGDSVSPWFGTTAMLEREGFRRVGPLGASVLMRREVRAAVTKTDGPGGIRTQLPE